MYRQTNRRVYDAMAEAGNPLCRPATDEELANPLKTVDGPGWLGESIDRWRVLCLAAGGGRQGALYAAAGGLVTVVDISPAMLRLDREVSRQRNLDIRLIEASMESLPMLQKNEFDLVIHPVSTCYVPDCQPVFEEVSRVLRPGGLYISQHKQPQSLQCSIHRGTSSGRYEIVHEAYRTDPVPAPEQSKSSERLRERGAIEYIHRIEVLLGGMARAGLSIEDLREPMHGKSDAERGSFADRAKFVPPYIRVKARRRGTNDKPKKRLILQA